MLVLGETVAGQSDRQLTGSSNIASPEVVRTVMQSEAQAGGRGRGQKLSETSNPLQLLGKKDYMLIFIFCCFKFINQLMLLFYRE